MKPHSTQFIVVILACLIQGITIRTAQGEVDYATVIKPILTEHCVRCHGITQQRSNLRLNTAPGILQGGERGAAIIPGQADRSLIMQAVTGSHTKLPRMPYKNPPLSEQQIGLLRQWIEEGAVAPDQEDAQAGLHWSFIAPQRPALPSSRLEGWARNAIDHFIAAKLEENKLSPSPETDRVTLIRRVSLDLTGLPPSPEEVRAFVEDQGSGAYETLVDRLLQSPHYGERWGRHWLDVARYADSNGYSVDAPRSIWPFRDYVIQAFNDDMPYDQFVMEQLAGDLLPDATLHQKVATGFHRNTQINQEGGIDKEQFRIESVVDRVNTTGTAFMGLTMGCAQCHTHKFDPITQEDYYRMFAFFNNQDEPNLDIPAADWVRASSPVADGKKKKFTTMVLRERKQPRDTFIHIKGDFTRPGRQVRPDIPALFQPLGQPDLNRLDLARWLVQSDHPLTARVMVNRIWQHYFGRGIVQTENDFGTQGTPPSHPRLLDWLATEFMSANWRIKHIHKLIVTSATYRQSSRYRPELEEIDSRNIWLARQNRVRLDAEIIRDVCLTVSGLLNRQIGGPSVYPPQPDGVMNLGQSRRPWKPSQDDNRYRRGLYTFFWRATPHPALTVFDAPDGFSSCTRRIRSNTPLQALTLLNDRQFHEFSEALSDRIQKEGPASAIGKVAYGFQLCVSRHPTPAEGARLYQLWEEETARGIATPWLSVARVLLNLDETITRE